MILSGLVAIFAGRVGAGIGSLILGPIVAVLGFMYARIMCEFMVVVFKIHENVKKIANKE